MIHFRHNCINRLCDYLLHLNVIFCILTDIVPFWIFARKFLGISTPPSQGGISLWYHIFDMISQGNHIFVIILFFTNSEFECFTDLGLFSTKSLMTSNPDHEVEIRTQRQQAPHENLSDVGKQVWKCQSSRSFTTVAKYAEYQVDSYKESMQAGALCPSLSVSVSFLSHLSSCFSLVEGMHQISRWGNLVITFYLNLFLKPS